MMGGRTGIRGNIPHLRPTDGGAHAAPDPSAALMHSSPQVHDCAAAEKNQKRDA
jgi:hypothetical protein